MLVLLHLVEEHVLVLLARGGGDAVEGLREHRDQQVDLVRVRARVRARVRVTVTVTVTFTVTVGVRVRVGVTVEALAVETECGSAQLGAATGRLTLNQRRAAAAEHLVGCRRVARVEHLARSREQHDAHVAQRAW